MHFTVNYGSGQGAVCYFVLCVLFTTSSLEITYVLLRFICFKFYIKLLNTTALGFPLAEGKRYSLSSYINKKYPSNL